MQINIFQLTIFLFYSLIFHSRVLKVKKKIQIESLRYNGSFLYPRLIREFQEQETENKRKYLH